MNLRLANNRRLLNSYERYFKQFVHQCVKCDYFLNIDTGGILRSWQRLWGFFGYSLDLVTVTLFDIVRHQCDRVSDYRRAGIS